MKVSWWSQMAFGVLGITMGGCLASVHWAQADLPQEKAVDTARQAKEHAQWIGKVLAQVHTFKPGMKRSTLDPLFTMEGGIRGGLTYVYRECPYIKVDFEFKPAPETKYDNEGRIISGLSPNDEIKSVSNPYLQYRIMD